MIYYTRYQNALQAIVIARNYAKMYMQINNTE